MSGTRKATWAAAVGTTLAGTAMLLLLAAASAPPPQSQSQSKSAPKPAARPVYCSPMDAAYSPDGKWLAVSDRSGGAVALFDAAGKLQRRVNIEGRAGMLAWRPDSSSVFVTAYDAAAVVEISAADGKVVRKLPVGHRPMGVAVAPKRGLLLVANSVLNDVSLLDLASGREKARVKVTREPWWIAISPDENVAVVSNLLPAGNAAEPGMTSSVSIVDLERSAVAAEVKLPPNSTSVRQTAISPDGRWAYAVHTVGRSNLPATQLDRGWVNTNAMSVIDLRERKHFATVLMDNLSEGAADPWGIELSKDGATMWVTLAGVHQLARIDLAGLHQRLEPKRPAAPAGAKPAGAPPAPDYGAPNVWQEIARDPARRADLTNDLAALYVAGLIQRTNLEGARGPRGLALAPDGSKVAIASYFTGEVLLADAATGKVVSRAAAGELHEPDEIRRGEAIFHDAHYAFQHWLSCATCHPNDGRVDGLNWDLPNDGIGNPKNLKSLVLAGETPPTTWTGVREAMEVSTMSGFRFAHLVVPDADVKATQAYIRSLRPEPTPFRNPDGSLTARAQRGKAIFESEKANCAHCHSGEHHTNLKAYDVGTGGPLDHPGQTRFDTPQLVELWRTAPYLHDGRAATLAEVFTKYNPADKHGVTSHLTREQIDDLVEYLLSLP